MRVVGRRGCAVEAKGSLGGIEWIGSNLRKRTGMSGRVREGEKKNRRRARNDFQGSRCGSTKRGAGNCEGRRRIKHAAGSSQGSPGRLLTF